jgi:hypothetical protein
MKIRAFLISDAITTAQGKLYIHGGGITKIAGSFPLTQPTLGVLLRLEREDEPLGTDHHIAIHLLDPEGGQIVEIESNYRVPGSANEEYPMTIDFVGSFSGLEFETPGLYRFAAFIDTNEIDSIPLALETEEEDGKWRSSKKTEGE